MSSLEARIKRRAGTLAAGLALSAAALAMLPGAVGADELNGGALGVVRGLQASPDATIQSSPVTGSGNGSAGFSGAAGVDPGSAVPEEASGTVDGGGLSGSSIGAQNAAEVAAPVVRVEGGTDVVAGTDLAPIAGYDPALAGPAAYGNVDGTVGVEAPIAPVGVGTQVEAGAYVPPVAGLDVCLGLGINQATGACDEAAAPVADGPVLTDPLAVPAVPVVGGSASGDQEDVAVPGGVATDGSLGTVGVNDGIDLNNTNVSPQVSVLGGSNEAATTQDAGSGGSGSGGSGGVVTDGSVGTIGVNDAVDLNNTNVVPQVSVLDGTNGSNTEQNTGGPGGSPAPSPTDPGTGEVPDGDVRVNVPGGPDGGVATPGPGTPATGGDPTGNVPGDEDDGVPSDGTSSRAPADPTAAPQLPASATLAASANPFSPAADPVFVSTRAAGHANVDGTEPGSPAAPRSGSPSETQRDSVKTSAATTSGGATGAADEGARILPETGGVEPWRAFLGLSLLLLGIAAAFVAAGRRPRDEA